MVNHDNRRGIIIRNPIHWRRTVKTFDELNHEEIVALTEAEIERFVEIDIAKAGIMPVDPPVPPSLEAEGIVRSVIGFSVGSSIFVTETDAIECASKPMLEEKYDYQIGYE